MPLVRRVFLVLFLAVLTLAARGGWAQDPAAKKLEGTWLGTLKVAIQELRLGLKIAAKPGGTVTGTMSSLDQGVADLAIEETAFKDGVVLLKLPKLKAEFEGKLSADGQELAGEWRQSGLKLPLAFKRVEKLPEITRPQDPKKPYPYREEEVVYENAKAGVKLAGTLTIPAGAGPFPAAVLISGSGAQNRNEEIFNHRPFLVIADYLTRRGVAVLRVDDRGVGGSTGNTANSTSLDFAEDVRAGLAFLRSRPEINPRKIGLIGHSEGGLIAPLVAAESKEVAFIVLLAGPGLPGEEILYLQGQALLRGMGLDEKKLALQKDVQRRVFAAVRAEKDPKALEEALKKVKEELFASISPEEKKEAEGLMGLIDGQFKMVQSPWFRFFLSHDPRPTLARVQCPVLALFGEKDFQVPPKENAPEVEKALASGGNQDCQVLVLPKLNHLFQTSTSGLIAEYGMIQETFAPAALEAIGDWVVKRVK